MKSPHLDNSLEAIFHRQIKRPLPKHMQGRVMEAFRKAVSLHKQSGDGRLVSAEPTESTNEVTPA